MRIFAISKTSSSKFVLFNGHKSMIESDEEYVAPNEASHANSGRPSSEDLSGSESVGSENGNGMSKRTRSSAKSNQPKRDLRGALKGANGGYSWEDEYQRSWDIVKDDEDGGRSLETIIQNMIESRKKKIMKNPSTPFQRGIIRSLVLIIDGSSVMAEKDLRPNRFSMMLSLLQDFIVEFFDQNPISQLGIVMMRNGIATRISEVSGLPQYHLDKLRQLKSRQHNRFEPKGDPSLQNSLEMARSLLTHNFSNSINDTKNSKEILVIFGALFTSDPGNIHKTIENLVKDNIKVKVIGLSAQVAICQEVVNRTNYANKHINPSTVNNYGVIMNETHFRELLMDCVIPLPVANTNSTQGDGKKVPLIKMGFPLKIQPSLTSSSNIVLNLPQLCACHPGQDSDISRNITENSSNLGSRRVIGYQCPQCKSKVCHLPTICPICGLMLILSTHLARSYHHLVPLSDYKEVPVGDKYDSSYCYGCLLKFPNSTSNFDGNLNKDKNKKMKNPELFTSSRYRCVQCANDFCIDCDVFVHETLHNCPGCENKVSKKS